LILKKSPAEIEQIAAAGGILVKTMSVLEAKVRPGVTTAELDLAAEKFIRSQRAEPAFKGYRGFPGSICASPNSMVVHGIPGPYRLARGDVLSIDVGVVHDGWVADAARTFPVGNVPPIARRLLHEAVTTRPQVGFGFDVTGYSTLDELPEAMEVPGKRFVLVLTSEQTSKGERILSPVEWRDPRDGQAEVSILAHVDKQAAK